MSLAIKSSRVVGGNASSGDIGMRGDPGLFGFLGGVARSALSVASDVLPGPAGAAARLASRAFGGGGPSVQPPAPGFPLRSLPGVGIAGPPLEDPDAGLRRLRGRRKGQNGPSPGAAARAPDEFPQRVGAAGECPPGFRPNKSRYFRRSPGGSIVEVPKGAVCVRSRRRNPLNPRALDRALGRVTSAKKAATKLSRVTIRKKC